MLLTKEQIAFILDRISERTVVEPTKEFPYRISAHRGGYYPDDKIGPIQAKLSIMLEVASKR